MSQNSNVARIELRLRELAQLFNSMDPSPFLDRDLDADAEEFIVSWAREHPHNHEFELLVHLAAAPVEERRDQTEEAVHHYFLGREDLKKRELRLLMRRGRMSLVVGLIFLTVCLGLGELVVAFGEGAPWRIAHEGLMIVGWVAMWRPLEIYLYEWWPLREDIRLLRRLARMKVNIVVK